jgi:hypothetical protein
MFMVIWYFYGHHILWPFSKFSFAIFSPVLVYCPKKNLATVLVYCTKKNLATLHGGAYPSAGRFVLKPLDLIGASRSGGRVESWRALKVSKWKWANESEQMKWAKNGKTFLLSSLPWILHKWCTFEIGWKLIMKLLTDLNWKIGLCKY